MIILAFVKSFGFLIIAMTVHEFAHGWVAYKLGDTTAKYSGRLTLNPLAHIDPLGTIVLPLLLFISTGGRFVFGAAKPVPINYWALRNPKRDIIWIGLAGPMANFILAAILSLVFKFLPVNEVVAEILKGVIYINVVLGVFNLVPIPPLDGSRVLMGILPQDLASKYASLERFGFIIILLLITLGMFNLMVYPVVRFILDILQVPSY